MRVLYCSVEPPRLALLALPLCRTARRPKIKMSEIGIASSLGGAQSPEDAAEALRVYGEQQHSHSAILSNLEDGESDDDDSDEDQPFGLCSEEDLLESYARCRDEDTVKGYRSAVCAFVQWLIWMKNYYDIKHMVDTNT